MCKVSVIIPTYNYGIYIEEAINSILNQSLQDWECIIIDDGSIDNTAKIIDIYCKKDIRFKYYYQSNKGLSAARNKGIELSKGKYIQLLDSDDLIEKDKLLIQSEYLENKANVDIVYSGMQRFFHVKPNTYFYTNSNPLKDKKWMPEISGKGHFILNTLIKQNIMVVSSPLIRKSVFKIVGFFDTKKVYLEDMDFWIKCALKNINFYYLDHNLTNSIIRSHENSLMTHNIAMIKGEIYMRKGFHKLLLNKYQKSINQEILINKKWELASFYIGNNQLILGFIELFGIRNILFFRFLYWYIRLVFNKYGKKL